MQQLTTTTTTVDFWLSFDFDRYRDLSTFQQEITDKTERASKARKHLAEATREFKKNPTQDVGELLRLYQTEIDALTKRSKSAEGMLLDTFRLLSEAPEPGPLLERSLQNDEEIAKLRFENSKLTKEVEEFEREFAKLKNQDITIRELEDKIFMLEESMETRTQQLLNEKLNEAEKQRLDADADVENELIELKTSLERADREAIEQRRAAESARMELYEVRAQAEEREASRGAELDLLQEEVLSLRAQLQQQIQQQNELLSASSSSSNPSSSSSSDYTTTTSGSSNSQRNKQKAMIEEEEMKRREEELTRAYLALDAARAEAQRAREAETQAIQRRERDLEEAKIRADTQRERERERVSELQSKIELLTSQLGNREKEESSNVNSSLLLLGDPKDRDNNSNNNNNSVLHQQNELVKSLESNLANTRVSLQERENELQILKNKYVALEERTDDLQELCNKLQAAEIALAGGNNNNNNTVSAMIGSSSGNNSNSSSSSSSGSAGDLRHISQPGTSSSQVSDMISIVQDQRDRFRNRMLELEEQLETSKEESSHAMELAETLRIENLAMAEKIRALSRMNRENNNKMGNNGTGSSTPLTTSSSLISATLNPTSLIGGKRSMSLSYGLEPSSSSYGFTYIFRFLLINSFARSLFLIYILALHMLVLASTHETVIQSSCNGGNNGGIGDVKMEKLRGSDPDRVAG
jgi:homeobox protein cut-like